jgi:hypothetical protein
VEPENETAFEEKRKKLETVKLPEKTQEIRQKPPAVKTKPSFSYYDRSNPFDLKENVRNIRKYPEESVDFNSSQSHVLSRLP